MVADAERITHFTWSYGTGRRNQNRGGLTCACGAPLLYRSSPFGSLVLILNDMEPVFEASHEGNIYFFIKYKKKQSMLRLLLSLKKQEIKVKNGSKHRVRIEYRRWVPNKTVCCRLQSRNSSQSNPVDILLAKIQVGKEIFFDWVFIFYRRAEKKAIELVTDQTTSKSIVDFVYGCCKRISTLSVAVFKCSRRSRTLSPLHRTMTANGSQVDWRRTLTSFPVMLPPCDEAAVKKFFFPPHRM